MQFIDLKIKDALIILPQRYHDQRGYFQEHFNALKYKHITCKQISYSKSHQHVIRGLHTAQYGKLVQCIQGKITDVVVDLRPESETYLQWEAIDLCSDEAKQVYIPPRCGHGFYAHEDSIIVYCQEGTFDVSKEMNVNPFDPTIGITWPVCDYIISEQDKNAPQESDARRMLDD